MRLSHLVQNSPRRLVVPLVGYPGSQLTNTSLKQNEFNWGVQFWSISELADTLQPDAIFFMMDLSIEAGALGFPIRYPMEESPSVEKHLVKTREDLEQFMCTDILKDARANVYIKTMELMSQNLEIPRGAYCIGPFTLAGLLMGASEAAVATIQEPEFLHEVLNFCTHYIMKYAVSLVDAGADMVAILEPTGVMLSPTQFEEFSGQYVKMLIRAIHTSSILHICGNTTHLIEKMCETGAEGLSLDSAVDFVKIAPRVKKDVVLIGNLDPVRVFLELDVEGVRKATQKFLEDTRHISNLILSSGCDLPQDTPMENIKTFIDVGKSFI